MGLQDDIKRRMQRRRSGDKSLSRTFVDKVQAHRARGQEAKGGKKPKTRQQDMTPEKRKEYNRMKGKKDSAKDDPWF
jgi:hypothetical protein